MQTFSEQHASCVQMCKTQIKTLDVRVLHGWTIMIFLSPSSDINIGHNIDLPLMGKEILPTCLLDLENECDAENTASTSF